MLWFSCFSINCLSWLLSLSTYRLLNLWFLIEVNLVSFLIILWRRSNKLINVNSVILYFLTQCIASIFIIISLSYFDQYGELLFVLRICYKRGVIPFHHWYISISNRVDLFSFLLLSTRQKIIPLQIVFSNGIPYWLSLLFLVSSLLRSVCLISRNSMIIILAFSSCLIIIWILVSSMLGIRVTWLFFIFYRSLIRSILIINFYYNYRINYSQNNIQLRGRIVLISHFIIYRGVPPRPLFLIKLSIITRLCYSNAVLLRVALIISSMVAIFRYLNIFFCSINLKPIRIFRFHIHRRNSYKRWGVRFFILSILFTLIYL